MVSFSLSTPSTLTTRHVTIRSLIKRAERGGIILKKILSYQRYGFRVSDSKYSTPRQFLMIDSPSTHDKGVIKCHRLEWWLLICRLHRFHRRSIGKALETAHPLSLCARPVKCEAYLTGVQPCKSFLRICLCFLFFVFS